MVALQQHPRPDAFSLPFIELGSIAWAVRRREEACVALTVEVPRAPSSGTLPGSPLCALPMGAVVAVCLRPRDLLSRYCARGLTMMWSGWESSAQCIASG
jgi:hypothetical protein